MSGCNQNCNQGRNCTCRAFLRDKLLLLLEEKPRTAQELAEILGQPYEAVIKNLRMMHRLAYIESWRFVNKRHLPVWSLGDEPHTPRPGYEVRKRERQQEQYLEKPYGLGVRIWGI